jgi:dipeptidyl-peptidase-4
MRRFMLALGLACLATSTAAGDFLSDYAETYRFRLGKPASITPTPDGKQVLFLRSGPRDFERRLYELDLATGEERELLRAERLLAGRGEELTDEERARRERMRLVARGIASYQLSQDGRRLLIPLSGRLFLHERESGESREITSEHGPALDARLSPDGKRVAAVRGGELFVVELAGGAERQLTRGAGGSITHGLAEFVAQEEMRRYRGFWWSPDSKTIAYQRTDTEGVELLSIADGMRPERPPSSSAYPRPGMRNARVELGIVSVGGGETTRVEWDRETYEYLASVRWKRNGPLTLLVQNRLQTESRLLAVDPANGKTRTLLVERDDAWLAIDQSVPYWLPEERGFLWTTERRGAWQLELRDVGGKLLRELTPLDLGLQGFVKYRAATDDVIVRASEDPTESHLFRIPLSGEGEARALTTESGQHSGSFGKPGDVWVHAVTPARGLQRWEVRQDDRATKLTLRSVAEPPPFEPNLEYTTVGDPPMHAVLIRPDDFDPEKKYPVIDHVYGGPTSQMVRKGPGRYLLDQWMANHGYVVVAIDGRGTPNRGRAWQRAVKHEPRPGRHLRLVVRRLLLGAGGDARARTLPRRRRRRARRRLARLRHPLHRALHGSAGRQPGGLRRRQRADLRGRARAAAADHPRHRGRQRLLHAQPEAGRRALPRGQGVRVPAPGRLDPHGARPTRHPPALRPHHALPRKEPGGDAVGGREGDRPLTYWGGGGAPVVTFRVFWRPLMNRVILAAVVALALAATGCTAHRLRLAEQAAEDGNIESSFRLTRSAARAGNAEAQQRLGLMYQKGEGTAKDDVKAAHWLRKAVKKLDTAGLYLATLYAKGRGLPEEDPDRAALLERLCDSGESRGCYALGVWYLEGELVEQSDEESLRWFRRASDTWTAGQAHISALLKSDELLRPVAELGLADAQFRLGELYATGDRLPKSDSEAAKWFYLAAVQDHPEAVVKMGWIYGEGTGVQKDYHEAFRWFTRGSELDVADAQYQLGLHYQRGVGVRRSDIEAHKWFNLAAAKGHWRARQKLEVVAKQLKPKQLAEAERLAVEWVPSTKE